MILKNCRYAILNLEDTFIMENIDIRILEGRIAEIGKDIVREQGEPLIDCSKMVAVPGMVDAHTHLFTYNYRGMFLDCDRLKLWNMLLENPVPSFNMEVLEKFLVKNGLTALLTLDPNPENLRLKKKSLPIIFKGRYLVKSFREKGFSKEKFIHVDSLRTFTPEEFSEIIRENSGSLVSIHIANTRNEVFQFKRKYGDFQVSYLEKINGLKENAVLVGVEWITSREIELIKASNAKVILTPQCSLLHSPGGFPPVKEFIKEKITFALGSCSLTCSSGFLFDELRELLRFVRSSYWDFKTSVRELFKTVLHGSSEILGISSESLSIGRNAYVTLFKAASPNYRLTNSEKVLENLVMFSEPEDVMYIITPASEFMLLKEEIGE